MAARARSRSTATCSFVRGRRWAPRTWTPSRACPSRCVTFAGSFAGPTTIVRCRAGALAARGVGPTSAARSCRRSWPVGSKTPSGSAAHAKAKRVRRPTPMGRQPTSKSCRASSQAARGRGITDSARRSPRVRTETSPSTACATSIAKPTEPSLANPRGTTTRTMSPRPVVPKRIHLRSRTHQRNQGNQRKCRRPRPKRAPKKPRPQSSQFLDPTFETCDGPLAHVTPAPTTALLLSLCDNSRYYVRSSSQRRLGHPRRRLSLGWCRSSTVMATGSKSRLACHRRRRSRPARTPRARCSGVRC